MEDVLTIQRVRDVLDYNPGTGQFAWRVRPDSPVFNGRFAAKPAINGKCRAGYLVGSLDSKKVAAHRLAWMHHYGEVPTEIDHNNGDKADNRIANLRNTDRVGNNRNRALASNNKSGVIGVGWSAKKNKWQAWITIRRRTKHLGYFADKEAAATARANAEAEYGFHPNHGRTTA